MMTVVERNAFLCWKHMHDWYHTAFDAGMTPQPRLESTSLAACARLTMEIEADAMLAARKVQP